MLEFAAPTKAKLVVVMVYGFFVVSVAISLSVLKKP